MVITAIGRVSAINGAQGQFVTKRVRFQANADLTGKTVYFNSGLYTSSQSPILPATSQYSIVYPAVGVITQMTFLGIYSDKNQEAAIEVIDSNTFDIIYSFFIIPNQGGWQPASSISNNSFSNSESLSGVNVGFFVKIDTDTAYKNVPIYSNEWCSFGGIEWSLNLSNGAAVDGYIAGSDLIVSFNIQATVSSNYFVGFYDKTGIGNNTDLITDLGLSYAEIIGSVSGQTDAAGNAIPTTAITAGTVINKVGTLDPSGSFTIDGASLISGKYVAYIVYQEGSQWRSCQLSIREGSIRECVSGDISVTITDCTGNAIVADIGTGLSEHAPVTVAVTMDKATYNANLAALGLTVDYDTNFQGITSTVSGVTLNAANNIATFVFDPSGQIRMDTIGITFEFLVEGELHQITKEIKLDFGVPSTEIAGVTEDSSTQEVTIICEETPDTYTFVPTVPQVYDKVFSNLNGGDYGDALVDGVLGMNSNGLAIDDVVCVKLLSNGVIDTNDCECPACETVLLELSATKFEVADEIIIDASVPNNGTFTLTELKSGLSSAGTNSAQVTVPDSGASTLDLVVDYVAANGCIYQFEIKLGQIDLDYQQTVQMVAITSIEPSCDCEEDETACNNSFNFITTCDESNQNVTIDVADTFASVVDTEVITVQVDGAAPIAAVFPIAVTGSEVIVKRSIVFTDACTLDAEQRIECELLDTTPSGSIACDYSALSVLCSYDAVTNEFSIATSGDTSGLSINELEFTLNDNAPVAYTDPVVGMGLFVANWTVQIEGCEAVVLTSYCSVLNCCNPFDFHCDEECELVSGTITCENDIITFTPITTNTDGWTFTWSGSVSGGGLGTDLTLDSSALPAQTFTLTATHDTCDNFAEVFVYDGTPDSGASTNPVGTPEIIN